MRGPGEGKSARLQVSMTPMSLRLVQSSSWIRANCQSRRPERWCSIASHKSRGAGMDHLRDIEARSIYILREAYANFKQLGVLWWIGRAITVLLWLARKACFGHVPFPLIHIDTSYKIPEMIRYRDQLVADWK